MIERDDLALFRNGHRMAEMRRFVVAHLRRGAKHGLPSRAAIVRGPDHAADAPIQVIRVHRIDGELAVVRGDLFSRDDTPLHIGGHLPPSDSRILRAKQAAEICHGPDFLRVRRMRDDVFDPAAAAGSKGLPCFSGES